MLQAIALYSTSKSPTSLIDGQKDAGASFQDPGREDGHSGVFMLAMAYDAV